MRFNTRMSLYAVIPAGLFLAALCVGLWGMKQSSTGFVRFLDHEQRLAQDLSDMYAQGLQTGQALRNIVLDPGNGKAYTNLQEADDREREGDHHPAGWEDRDQRRRQR